MQFTLQNARRMGEGRVGEVRLDIGMVEELQRGEVSFNSKSKRSSPVPSERERRTGRSRADVGPH